MAQESDGGIKSRKLWLSLLTSLSIVGTAVLSAYLPPLVPMYDTIVGGLISVLALYLGGNVGAKYVLRPPKNAKQD